MRELSIMLVLIAVLLGVLAIGSRSAHATALHAGACLSPNGAFGWQLASRIDYGDDAPIRVRVGRFVDEWIMYAEVAQARPRDMGCGNLIGELLALGGPGDGS